MAENEAYNILAEDLKILKEFFGQIPPTGNQIVILVIGSSGAERALFGAMKTEIAELKEALRKEIHGGVSTGSPASTEFMSAPSKPPQRSQPKFKKPKGPAHLRAEIVQALRESGGNKRKAAESLQWRINTVWTKIRDLKIKPEEYGQ